MSARAGGFDWVARWGEMQAAAEAASERPRDEGGDRWQHRAARFDRRGREHHDTTLDALAEGVLGSDTVADIGAGAGRHAVPLARRCERVVAVEPSPAMRERLEARVSQEGAAGVTVVADAWPCSIPIVDVAYSSHVLYGVADVVGFVEAMTAVARRSCRLVLGLRAPAEGLAALFRAVHGRDRPPRPAALEALLVLHQLGRRASLKMVPGSERPLGFSPTDDDLDDLCHRLSVPADEQGRARVSEALDRLYPRSPEGAWGLGVSGPNALIEWPGEAP